MVVRCVSSYIHFNMTHETAVVTGWLFASYTLYFLKDFSLTQTFLLVLLSFMTCFVFTPAVL